MDSLLYALRDEGINGIVFYAADVPTTQYEEVMKTDIIYSINLARFLCYIIHSPIISIFVMCSVASKDEMVNLLSISGCPNWLLPFN